MERKKKDMRYLCYPYMRESAATVDFEIRTDSLAVRIGAASALVNAFPNLKQHLIRLTEMAYHVNGSVRGNLAVTERDLEELSLLYDQYVGETKEELNQFVLPLGSNEASSLHIARSEAKKSVRALHKVSQERDVPNVLFDYIHLLANVLFVMAVYVNKQLGIAEIPFKSKSYPKKRRESEND
ncbi:ATP:cob(I)alamin adenosyltransferase [Alkalihalobacillus xiaoxiensis]|uniref:Corrinoid adenosyltransferase n=1 Tax=Shouchella xiaoxiensis TaxID=766895 RepID=A0ABS2SYC4_9BACI|nr:hypothetical protein [Shouchella xiaoxiensis]MBM7840528.1 ATP:cob(I)alamin adenosyltransferase [Shouchella xiaoxiensis]